MRILPLDNHLIAEISQVIVFYLKICERESCKIYTSTMMDRGYANKYIESISK